MPVGEWLTEPIIGFLLANRTVGGHVFAIVADVEPDAVDAPVPPGRWVTFLPRGSSREYAYVSVPDECPASKVGEWLEVPGVIAVESSSTGMTAALRVSVDPLLWEWRLVQDGLHAEAEFLVYGLRGETPVVAHRADPGHAN